MNFKEYLNENREIKKVAKDAINDIEEWLRVDSSEFFSMDADEQFDVLSNDIEDFFERFSSEYKLDLYKYKKQIVKEIIKEL